MILYVVIAVMPILALYLQWKDGHVGFGNTPAGMQLPRSLWFSTSVFTGIAVDRVHESSFAILAGCAVFCAAMWITRRFEAYIEGHGQDSNCEGRPLAHLAQTEARLQTPSERR